MNKKLKVVANKHRRKTARTKSRIKESKAKAKVVPATVPQEAAKPQS